MFFPKGSSFSGVLNVEVRKGSFQQADNQVMQPDANVKRQERGFVPFLKAKENK